MIDLFTITCLCAKDITRHATLRYNEASWEKHEAVRVTSVSKRGVAWCSSCTVVMIKKECASSQFKVCNTERLLGVNIERNGYSVLLRAFYHHRIQFVVIPS
jgi:hypothetical protein